MKCLISLNSPELTKEFGLKQDTWKDHLSSAEVWDGQEMPYERVMKLRIEGLPIILRDENYYKEIARAYGKVIDPVDFSWEVFDVSAGTCMVLYDSGNQIDEEITIIISGYEGGDGGRRPRGMDLEEGEFRPVVEPEVEAAELPAITVSRNQVEGEQLRAEDNHFLHGDSKSAHVVPDSLGSPCTPRHIATGPSIGPGFVGPALDLGQSTCASSRKRPRVFRSPISIDSPNNLTFDTERGNRNLFPSFPDLNNPVLTDPSSSFNELNSDGFVGSGSNTVVPESKYLGNTVGIDKEVEDTIEVGTCIGIQVEDFTEQVRVLIQGEGNGLQ
ncbi:hypothetical protein L1987_78815 [Smallanthus sonchifolius]|uniref:Uncharacterized protein n=1 Tax=Smallanthus sonchifolius TaxID=185202 RepID=A0ACB8ZDZ8_9ASTR|nr:hypothetical protein L1987_78815 [Smallanthus sonchifolius]